MQAELDRLGFSPAAREAADKALQDLNASLDPISQPSDALKQHLWAGSEPHPDGLGAFRIVLAMRALDGE